MTRITVQGIGVVGAFGAGIGALRQALELGSSPRTPLSVPTGAGPVELSVFQADTSPLKELLSSKVLRRMDHFTKLGLLASRLALADAGLADTGHEGLGVIIASGYGATATTYALLDSIIADGDACSSPTHFAGSLHNACPANIAIVLGATGPSLTVSQFDLSVPSALLTARQWLLDGRVERVLFGAVDELSDLIGYHWLRTRGLPRPEPMTPLCTKTESAVPGEGAAFLVLSRVAEARPGYCTLESVLTGRGQPCLPSAATLLMLNADGRQELGSRYAAAGSRIACSTPLYGSMPASPAFDLAVAALLLKEGRVVASPGASVCDGQGQVATVGPLGADRIACLTLAEEDGYGLVELGRLL